MTMTDKQLVKKLNYLIENLRNKKIVPTGRIDYTKAVLLEIVLELEKRN